jgi:tetratricopeptide (TPR) repeat protein/uncharacterized caspase-like protein
MSTSPRSISSLVAAVTLCLMISAGASAQDKTPASTSPRTLAVVIGISKYPKLPGGQQLQFADRDATAFADALRRSGVAADRIKLLSGPEATLAAIKSAIGTWLARSASEGDTVIIFFSGHGVFESEFGESYLLGYDSDPRDPYSSALSITEFGNAIAGRIKAQHTLILADAVRRDFFDPDHDGAASARWFFQAFNRLAAARTGVAAILANGPGEFSREGQRWSGRGVFTKFLVDALSAGYDRNGDGLLTADELFEFVSSKVAADTANKQNPWRADTELSEIAVASATRTPEVAAAPLQRRIEPAKAPDAAAPTRSPETAPARPEPQPSVTTPRVAETSKPVTGDTSPPKAQPGATPSSAPAVTRKQPEPAKSPKAKPGKSQKQGEPPVVADNRPAAPTPDSLPNPSTTNKPPEPSVKPSTEPGVATSPGAKPTTSRAPAPLPPKTSRVTTTQPAGEATAPASAGEIATESSPPAPKPTALPPNVRAVGSEAAGTNQPAKVATSLPTLNSSSAPSPLPLQVEAAIIARNLIEPKGASAWDLYQRLTADPSSGAEAARIKPTLVAALLESGKAIALGDIRSDNVSEKTDEIRRAGQMFTRARSLAPENPEVASLEKLSAAQGLIALQFYDEAERSLAALSSARIAATENALGLAYQGKLDNFRAERAFKRAIELDSKWAAPHYNLALLYRSEQKDGALAELEAAAELDPTGIATTTALGDEYFERQQWQKAADAFRKAIALKPSDDALHTKLGHSLFSQGKQEEANREYQKARELRGKP